MSSKEICTPPASRSVAATKIDLQDIAAAASSIHTSHTSDADESDLEEPEPEPTGNQARESKSADKGKDRDLKKHGMMALPAEIRERYAFPSFLWAGIHPLVVEHYY